MHDEDITFLILKVELDSNVSSCIEHTFMGHLQCASPYTKQQGQTAG